MISVLIVLYNKSLQQSDTLRGIIDAAEILNNANASVLLWDNSLQPHLTQEDIFSVQQKISIFNYHHAPENISLSRIYNSFIEENISQKNNHYLILLDDDSKISAAYFNEVVSIINKNEAFDVLLPVVKNGDKIVSPAAFFYCKGNYFKSLESGICKQKLLAINSGMIISFSFIQKNNFRYNEQLNNYGTDNYFMNFANNHRARFYILNYSFDHSLNFFDNDDLEKKIEIFRQIKKANSIVFSSGKAQSLLIIIYNFAASFKNSLKYKSMKFFS
jgi:hypothetical protein